MKTCSSRPSELWAVAGSRLAKRTHSPNTCFMRAQSADGFARIQSENQFRRAGTALPLATIDAFAYRNRVRSRAEIVARLIDPGIIAVVRTDQSGQVAPICDALLAGGVHALEITLTVPDALGAIRAASRH